MTPPILGIFASAVTGGVSTTSFESIATTTVGAGGSSSVTFSSIPSTYTHLQVRITAKGNRGIVIENALMTFNSDSSSSNYYNHAIFADTSVNAVGEANTGILIYTFAGNGGTTGSNVFGANVIDILDYTNTNKNKVSRAIGGYENNSAGLVGFGSGLWKNTNAITSITFTPSVGTSWLQYSNFALYGIKVAA